MFLPLLPIQQIALAGMLQQRNEIALEQLKTLQKIEQQNKLSSKKIGSKNFQIVSYGPKKKKRGKISL